MRYNKQTWEYEIEWNIFWLCTGVLAAIYIAGAFIFHWEYAEQFGYGWGFCWLISGTGFFATWIPAILFTITERPGR